MLWPLNSHLQRLAIEALAVADVAGHVDIRQELHFDAQLALALAGLAAAAVHVEGEAPGLVAAHLALRQLGEELADLVEHAGVGARIGARRAPDGGLVDVDDLVEMLDAVDALVFAGLGARAHQLVRQGVVQHLGHQGGLAAARTRP